MVINKHQSYKSLYLISITLIIITKASSGALFYLGLAGGVVIVGGVIAYMAHRHYKNKRQKQQKRKQEQRIQNQIQNSDYIQQFQKQNQEIVWKIVDKYKKLRNKTNQPTEIKKLFIIQQIQIIQAVYNKAYQQQNMREYQEKNVIFIGNTSAGKSRLLNKLFNLELQTGKGETTKQFRHVTKIKDKINIFDSVDYNDQSTENVQKYRQQLAQINLCHLVFICFDNSLKSLSNLVQIICKSRDRLYKVAFVITKCDLIEPEQQSLAQLISVQIKYLEQSLGIKNAKEYPIFMSSAKCDKLEGAQNQNYKILNMINALQYA